MMDPEDRNPALGAASPKRPRNFVARQACDACRQKKTRCDEDVPCGQCRSLGLQCHYGARKITKQEASLSTIMQGIRRLERKLDSLPTGAPSLASLPEEEPAHVRPASGLEDLVQDRRATPATDPAVPISFSAHLTLAWPGVSILLPDEVHAICQDHGFHYMSELELHKPSMTYANPASHESNWLSQTSIATFKTLSQLFFSHLNTTFPILDREVYFQRTLVNAMNSDFGDDLDTSIVLIVMALGSWCQKSLESRVYSPGPVDSHCMGSDFFREARKRMAFHDCETGLQTCQLHLLIGLYYAQTLQPAQWWLMTNRAAVCSSIFWRKTMHPSTNSPAVMGPAPSYDEWEKDMQSRLFWIITMFNTLLTDEMDLPTSHFLDQCDDVPLPKFVPPAWLSNFIFAQSADDDAFFHYHFLSQIAHRTLLTRIRDTLFISNAALLHPSAALELELQSQLEHWRNQLPSNLAFDLKSPLPDFDSTAKTSAAAWLRARYVIAHYHMGRPLLHRALSHPKSLGEEDVAKCGNMLSYVLEWTTIMERILSTSILVPYRYFVNSQLFGQVVVVYSLSTSQDVRLRRLVTEEHCRWCRRVLDILAECAEQSNTTARDLEIGTILLEKMRNVMR